MEYGRQLSRQGTTRARRNRVGLFIILPFMALIALIILKQEVPQFDSWIQRIWDEEKWHAGDSCRHEAIRSASRSDFARIIENGIVHPTEKGYFVEGVVVGEMGDSGAELKFQFSCYTQTDGTIVKTNKQ